MPVYAIGVDIGGTSTDCYATDGAGGWRGKAPTTPRAFADGLLTALEVLADTGYFALGTTAVTNWLAQQVGAPAGLVAPAASATSGRWCAATGSGSRA